MSDCPSLRYCMSAGEHLSDEMLGLWKDRFNQDIFEAIGMSECSYYISHSKTIQLDQEVLDLFNQVIL